jgi:nucleoside-diphosphate-sugar epimerase
MSRRLEELGFDVTGWDIGVDARKEFRENDTRFDLVIHAAAVGADRWSIDTGPLDLAADLELDAGLFQWAHATRPRRVVYLSSSAAYPMVLQQASTASDRVNALVGHKLAESNINHKYPQEPDGIYGRIKLMGEYLAHLYARAGGSVTVVRPFSGYGEGQGTRFPVGALAARAQAREDPFTIWGSGDQVRDFIHIDDICEAIMQCVLLEHPGPVNLGTGQGTSMIELAGMFCREAGFWPMNIRKTGRLEGAYYRVADTKLMSDLYVPKISLAEGVKRMMSR